MLYSSHLDGAEEVGVVATEGGGVLLVFFLVGGERCLQGVHLLTAHGHLGRGDAEHVDGLVQAGWGLRDRPQPGEGRVLARGQEAHLHTQFTRLVV